MNTKALLVIDLQNDYFPNGHFPLWNTENVLKNIKSMLNKAQQSDMPVIYIQHEANSTKGDAPFFNKGTEGVKLHPEIVYFINENKNSQVVIKHHADSFENTHLNTVLESEGVNELLICGMMTQNCVTHTAISKAAEKYSVSIVVDCCTSVDEMIHNIALNAISTRVPFVLSEYIF